MTYIGNFWYEVKDGNSDARELCRRHYSYLKAHKSGLQPKNGLVLPPGQKMLLLSHDAEAVFGWVFNTVDRYDCEFGVNCTVFRNESETLSSLMILEAELWAWERWPRKRLFTYVDPPEIKSINPGACFKKAGWKFVRKSQKGLHLLEKKCLKSS